MMAHTIMIRPATADDTEDIFNWRNDALTRTMSRNAAEVQWQQHQIWYQQALLDPHRILLMAVNADLPAVKIGMVRFDMIKTEAKMEADRAHIKAQISINLAPAMRGKSYAKPALHMALDYLWEHQAECQMVLAEVKTSNIASQTLFMGCGFMLISQADEFYHYQLAKL